jgi:uncharacterized protein
MAINILVVTKGHPFDFNGFFGMLDAIGGAEPGLCWTHVEQPAAQLFLNPENAAPYDAILFYDMPGYRFKVPDGVDVIEPSPALVRGFNALLAQGKGLVFLHHALASWAAWPDYGEAIGGRFLYQPSTVRGVRKPDSGYRHEVEYIAQVVADHPVTTGVDLTFDIKDELYLAEIFEESVTPLVRARHDFTAENFYSADAAVHGRMFSNEGWSHAPGSNLVGWTKRSGNAPVVYLQFGDGPSAYENQNVRKLIGNALHWVASPEARQT